VPGAELRGVTLDCADPQTLAGFYGALTGMRELFGTDGFVALTNGSGCDLGFQRVDGYRLRSGQVRTCPSSSTWISTPTTSTRQKSWRWNSGRPNRTTSPAADAGESCWIRPATPSA
jgi:hypothetical protein